jgi:hypothetical protein
MPLALPLFRVCKPFGRHDWRVEGVRAEMWAGKRIPGGECAELWFVYGRRYVDRDCMLEEVNL